MYKPLEQMLFGADGQQRQVVVVAEKAEQGVGDLDGMVGEMFWFTLPAALRVDRDVLADVYAAAGIAPRFLPPVVREADAFRRLTKELECAGQFQDAHGQPRRVSLLVREVASDHWRVVRHMIAEVRDERHVRLLYAPCVQFVLDKTVSRVSVAHLAGMADIPESVKPVIEQAEARFSDGWQTATRILDDGHIRRSLDSLMKAEKVVDLRPNGGLYFALVSHARVVRQIERMLDGLHQAGGPDAAFCSAPLVDREKQRQAVAQAALRHVIAEAASMQAIMADVVEAVKGGRKMQIQTAQDYLREVKRLRDLVEEYRMATQESLSDAEAAIEVLKTQAMALMTMAE